MGGVHRKSLRHAPRPARAFGTAEYRAKIYEFDFFSLWRVQVDGAVFGEVGRVFISSKDLREEFGPTDTQANGETGGSARGVAEREIDEAPLFLAEATGRG